MPPEDGTTSTTRNTAAGGSGSGTALKKGPWTSEEDAVLMEYVNTHGEGSWNAVQRNSGLLRYGKSCRLRWANHLRPNLKKRSIYARRRTTDHRASFQVRQQMGSHDTSYNEIKNYWNTRLKRRLRAGLPIYPVDFHRRQHEQSIPNQIITLSSSSLSFDQLNYNVMNTPFYLQNSQSNLDILHSNTRFPNRAFLSSLQSNLAMIQIPKLEPFSNEETELPSIQSSSQPITPACSSNDQMITRLNDGNNAISPYICHRENSGLLEDGLGESRALISSQVHSNQCKSSETDKGEAKIVDEHLLIEEEPENVTFESIFETQETNKTAFEESSPDHSSIEIRVNSRSDVFDEMIVMDDDFSSWLDFPNENQARVSNNNMNQVVMEQHSWV
ncbi:putative transcription factor MYB-HB-like family [Helianthus debilis subsp. tardiflorus]